MPGIFICSRWFSIVLIKPGDEHIDYILGCTALQFGSFFALNIYYYRVSLINAAVQQKHKQIK